jgi:hypothetical protein
MKKVIMYFALLVLTLSACEKVPDYNTPDEELKSGIDLLQSRIKEFNKALNRSEINDSLLRAEVKRLEARMTEKDAQISILKHDINSIEPQDTLRVYAVERRLRDLVADLVVIRAEADNLRLSVSENANLLALFPPISDLAILIGAKTALEQTTFKDFVGMVNEYVKMKSALEYIMTKIDNLDESADIYKYIDQVEENLLKSTMTIKNGSLTEGSLAILKGELAKMNYATKEYVDAAIQYIIEHREPDEPKNEITSIEIINAPKNKIADGITIRFFEKTNRAYLKKEVDEIFDSSCSNPLDLSEERIRYTGEYDIYVKINPSDIDIRDYSVSLINSKGEKIPNLLLSCSKHDDLITRANLNIYKITLSLNPSNYPYESHADAFNAMTNNVLYCLAFEKNGQQKESPLCITFTDHGCWHNISLKDYMPRMNYESEITFDVKIGRNNAPVNDITNVENKASGAWKRMDYITNESFIHSGNSDYISIDAAEESRRKSYINSYVRSGEVLEINATKKMLDTYKYYVKVEIIDSEYTENEKWHVINYLKGINKIFVVKDSNEATTIIFPVDKLLSPIRRNDHFLITLYFINYDGTYVDPDGKSFQIFVE